MDGQSHFISFLVDRIPVGSAARQIGDGADSGEGIEKEKSGHGRDR